MAKITRDGTHQGRQLRFDESGFELLTVDYDAQEKGLDWRSTYEGNHTESCSNPSNPMKADTSRPPLCGKMPFA